MFNALYFLTQINRLIRLTPTSSRHRSAEGYLSVCDEDTANSVARVAAVAQVTL